RLHTRCLRECRRSCSCLLASRHVGILFFFLPFSSFFFCFFFFKHPPPTEIYTLSLHDALPICRDPGHTDVSVPLGTIEDGDTGLDRKSTRLNSSHVSISYAVFCLKKKKKEE